MKPSEKLEEIKSRHVSNVPYWLTEEDKAWLIARVKKLTEALEFYAIPGHMECDSGLQARQALEYQPPTDKRGGDE